MHQNYHSNLCNRGIVEEKIKLVYISPNFPVFWNLRNFVKEQIYNSKVILIFLNKLFATHSFFEMNILN
jgi:hypothetical protein